MCFKFSRNLTSKSSNTNEETRLNKQYQFCFTARITFSEVHQKSTSTKWEQKNWTAPQKQYSTKHTQFPKGIVLCLFAWFTALSKSNCIASVKSLRTSIRIALPNCSLFLRRQEKFYAFNSCFRMFWPEYVKPGIPILHVTNEGNACFITKSGDWRMLRQWNLGRGLQCAWAFSKVAYWRLGCNNVPLNMILWEYINNMK